LLGLPLPGASQLRNIVDELVPARNDAQPLIRWPGAEVRRYRNQLYIIAADALGTTCDAGKPVDGNRVAVGPGLGTLVFTPGAPAGLSGTVIRSGLELRFREGGEDFQPSGQAHTRKLKKLLQEAGVVPWMRERLPLLYSNGQLVAVADLWIAAHAVSEPGVAVGWENCPALY